MAKEIKIEDFISKEELNSLSEREREIYDKIFQSKKERLQKLKDAEEKMNEIKEVIENLKND